MFYAGILFRSDWTVLNSSWIKPPSLSPVLHSLSRTNTTQQPLRSVAMLGHTLLATRSTHFCSCYTANVWRSRDISVGTAATLLAGRAVTLRFPGRRDLSRPSANLTQRHRATLLWVQTAGTGSCLHTSVYCQSSASNTARPLTLSRLFKCTDLTYSLSPVKLVRLAFQKVKRRNWPEEQKIQTTVTWFIPKVIQSDVTTH